MLDNKQYIGTLPSRLDLSWAGHSVSLEKGQLNEAFSYSDLKDIKIKKTGKEIKESMNKTIVHENSQIDMLNIKLELYKVKDIDPTGIVSDYRLRGYSRHSFGNLPKVYSYRQKYPEDYVKESQTEAISITSVSGFDSNTVQVQKVDDKTKSAMNMYNDCVSRIIESMVEIKIAETIKGGMEDKKSYDLTVKQAGALGF